MWRVRSSAHLINKSHPPLLLTYEVLIAAIRRLRYQPITTRILWPVPWSSKKNLPTQLSSKQSTYGRSKTDGTPQTKIMKETFWVKARNLISPLTLVRVQSPLAHAVVRISHLTGLALSAVKLNFTSLMSSCRKCEVSRTQKFSI